MFWTALALVTLAAQPTPSGLSPQLQRVERVLANEKIASDGPGLLAYVKAQTVTAEDDGRLKQLIKDLGADDFDRREMASQKLIEAGRKALPYLRGVLNSDDREVVRRANLCLESLVDGPLLTLMPGVVRLLGEHRPAGTVPVLLGYLSSAGDEAVEDSIFEQLRVLGVREGELDPALVSALEAGTPLVRAAAAHVAGDLKPTAAVRQLLLALLRDPLPRLRFEAAQALLRGGDGVGLAVLIELIEKGPVDLALLADEVIAGAAGEEVRSPPLGLASEVERKATAAAWDRWHAGTAGRAGWAAPAGLEPRFGRILVAEFDSDSSEGRIAELGRDGKRRWQLEGLKGPNDVQPLPRGRLLVAERGGDRVNEYDRGGKVHWSHRTTDSPIGCQRLGDGTTLVITFTEAMIVNPEGKKQLSYVHREGLRHGRVGADGVLRLMTSQGEILSLNRKGELMGKITPSNHGSGAGYWGCFTRLEPDRFLAAFGSAGKVVELNGMGKIESEWNVSSPVSVVRLRSGHTLIGCFEGRQVVELDREGREVWKAALKGRPFYALRY